MDFKLASALGAAALAGYGLGVMTSGPAKKQGKKCTVTTASPDDFDKLFSSLLASFLAQVKRDYDLSAAHMERLKWLFEYNCIGGKCYRATLAVGATQSGCDARGLDFATKAEQAMVLGWCVEVLQACFLVADDIMDGSQTRRGQPCWYLQPTIQMDAVNDSLILESFIYFLLKEYFEHDSELYTRLVELFHTVSLQTQIGQMLDLTSQPQGRKGPDVLKNFSLSLYQKIVKYKTACYTFFLPLASGMLLAGYRQEDDFELARAICMALGEKFQIQDDYLDCYQDPVKLGKIGTDIQDHKCSWLCVQALEKMSAEQRVMFEATYGKEDDASVAKIKALFVELQLEQLYLAQEAASYKQIENMIAKATKSLPDMFTPILKKIHLRQK